MARCPPVSADSLNTDPLGAFRAVWNQVLSLPPTRQAMFALGCAERLAHAAGRTDELLPALEAGWTVACGGSADLAPLLADLDARDDLDDDELAATFYALRAAAGSPQDCRWAASRAMDAAFALVDRDDDTTLFSPLAVEGVSGPVLAELTWQQTAAARLAESGASESVLAWLRGSR